MQHFSNDEEMCKDQLGELFTSGDYNQCVQLCEDLLSTTKNDYMKEFCVMLIVRSLGGLKKTNDALKRIDEWKEIASKLYGLNVLFFFKNN